MLARRKILLSMVPLLGLGLLAVLWIGGNSSERRVRGRSDAGTSLVFPDRGERPRLQPVAGTGEHGLTGHLRGADGEPVAGASITATAEIDGEGAAFGDAGVDLAIVANSDLDGRFTLVGTGVGSYRLRIEGDMLVTAEVRFVDSPGQELELLVARRIKVSGRVHLGGQARSEVQVFLQGEGSLDILQTTSGPGGSFSLDAAEGAFRIWARAEAHAARVQRVERLGKGPFEELSLPLEPAYSIGGRVVEAGGSELGVSALVTLRSAEGLEAEHQVRALDDGSFTMGGLLAGRWIAEASAPGFVATLAPAVDVESAPALRITLDSGGRIVGQVVGPDRQALAGVQLRLVGKRPDGSELVYSSRSSQLAEPSARAGQRLLPMGELGVLLGPIPLIPPLSSSITRIATPLIDGPSGSALAAPWPDPSRFVSDADGGFLIAGVVPGDYRLVGIHPAYAESTSGPIAVKGSGQLPTMILRMLVGTQLRGTIRDKEGLAIAGASVFVRFDDGREPSLTVSDQLGHYEFPALRGVATIVVEAVGHERATRKRKLEGRGTSATNTEIDFRLARADSYIESRVVDSTGFAVRFATLQVEASEKLLPTAAQRSDEHGIFRIEGLPSGEHWLSVRHPDYPETRVRLSTGQASDLVLEFGGGLSVSLRDRQSQASIAMATIKVSRLPKGNTVQTMSDERGAASVHAMTPGRYALEVEAVGYGAQREEFSVQAGKRVGEVTRALVIELSRGAILAGILRDGSGDRVAGATLRVGSVQTQSDAEGRFRLENVAPGTIALEIEKDSERERQQIDVEPGDERLTMELVFRPAQPDEEKASEQDQEDEEEEPTDDNEDE